MKNATDITILLDRSGSMESVADDVRGGIKTLIEENKQEPGACLLTLVQFDSQDHQQVDIDAEPIKDVSSDIVFAPRGGTPLLDALWVAMERTGSRLAAMDEADRPDKVVFVLFTDGYENCSKEVTQEQLRDKVKRQQEDYNWQFLFLGADIDAFVVGGSIGFTSANVIQTAKSKTLKTYSSAGRKLRAYRSSSNTSDLAWTEQDRKDLS